MQESPLSDVARLPLRTKTRSRLRTRPTTSSGLSARARQCGSSDTQAPPGAGARRLPSARGALVSPGPTIPDLWAVSAQGGRTHAVTGSCAVDPDHPGPGWRTRTVSRPVGRIQAAVVQTYVVVLLWVVMKRLSITTVSVLQAIASGYKYGFNVIDRTGLPSGTVYPALSRLERDGLVRSAWEGEAAAHAEGRPPRRNYRMTAHGVKALAEAASFYRALLPARPRAVRS